MRHISTDRVAAQPINPLRAFFAGMLALSLAGCPASEEQTTSESVDEPFRGLTIVADVPKGLNLQTAWSLALDEWSAQTGASATVREYDGIESLEAPNESADLLLFPLTAIARLEAQGRLARLPSDALTAHDLDWVDLLQGLRENVAQISNEPTVIPISCPVLVCYYRRDLLQAAGFQPPETWAEYLQLLDARKEWAGDLPIIEPWDETFRATLFLAHAASYAKHPSNYSVLFDITTQEPLIDSEAFVKALDDSTAAVAAMPKAVLSYTPSDCRREIVEGRAAMAIAFESGIAPASQMQLANNPSNSSDHAAAAIARPPSIAIAFCRLPGVKQVFNTALNSWERRDEVNFVTLVGFDGLAMAVSAQSSPERIEAAWNLLAALTVEDASDVFPPGTRSLCARSQYEMNRRWIGPGLSENEAVEYTAVVGNCLTDTRLIMELPVVGRDTFRSILTREIGRVLTGGVSSREALQAVAQSWREAIANLAKSTGDKNVVRDSYRRSLNLPIVRSN